MVFPNFHTQEDLANNNNANDLQHQPGTHYDQSTMQASNAAGAFLGYESNSIWPPRNTLGGQSSQINAGMLNSFAQQQAFSHQQDNLLATIQNQQQFLPPSFPSMLGGNSLQQFAHPSSASGSGLGMGGLFNAMSAAANSNFPSSSIGAEANVLHGGSQLDSGLLANNSHALFLQQQQQQQFQLEQQQQWLLQQQQLQQQIQQNQLQLQQLQRQPLQFSDFPPRISSPSHSTTNSPLIRPVTTLEKVDAIHEMTHSDRTRPSRRAANTVLKSSSKVKTFPEKLMQAMLENRDEDAVGWLPDGKSFVIVSPDKFVDHVLTKEFKALKYASFVRKLHRWGFVRLTSGTGTDCFHHPLFQKNRKDLASKIKSISNDPTKKGQLSFKLSSSKPPSLAGVDKFVRAKAMLKSVSSGAQPDSELASIRSDMSEFQALENTPTELVEL